MDYEKYCWDFFKGKGLTDEVCAGILGNLYAESGINPKNMEDQFQSKLGYNDDTYTKAIDNGSYTRFAIDACGYGICQFTFSTYKQQLLNAAKNQKKSISDIGIQCQLMYDILIGNINIRTKLKNTKTIRDASNVILLDFEKPADQSVTVQNLRASYGEKYYQKYTGKSAPVQKTPEEITVDKCFAKGIITDKAYWLAVLSGKQLPTKENLKALLDKYCTRIV